ncbi:MAG: hypothetical protein HY831_04420 [Candidatus Aenigmarchaeota archaeon]|nr:hypothetical protein [Candidatus Aenigmarchaeota archaeon]
MKYLPRNIAKSAFLGALYILLGVSPVADDTIQGSERRLYEYGIRSVERLSTTGDILVIKVIKSDGSQEIYASFGNKDNPDVVDKASGIYGRNQITDRDRSLFDDCLKVSKNKRPLLLPDYKYYIL